MDIHSQYSWPDQGGLGPGSSRFPQIGDGLAKGNLFGREADINLTVSQANLEDRDKEGIVYEQLEGDVALNPFIEELDGHESSEYESEK